MVCALHTLVFLSAVFSLQMPTKSMENEFETKPRRTAVMGKTGRGTRITQAWKTRVAVNTRYGATTLMCDADETMREVVIVRVASAKVCCQGVFLFSSNR